MRRTLLVLVVLALLVAACGDDPPDSDGDGAASESVEPTPTVTATETVEPSPTETAVPSACANQESALADKSLRQPGRLAGELDDDGVRDDVHLVTDPSGDLGCQAFVVVESEGAVRAAAIEVPQFQFEMGFPRLIGLPLIDDRPGAEIVIGVAAGASTQFAAVFTSVEGRIVPVLRKGAANLEQSLLAFGGSVGHQEGFDCAPEVGAGAVVVSEARPVGNGAKFEYVRRFFFPQTPTVFAEDESLREEGSVRFDRFDSLHEFPNAPFGSCPTGEIAG